MTPDRAQWVDARAAALFTSTDKTYRECWLQAAREWNARHARLTLVQGGAR